MSDICEHDTFKDICAVCHRDNVITRLTAHVAELEESIEDAHQAASETQPSWKHRCYAIMAALGVDYGDPDWMMPDEHKALTARVAELEADLRWIDEQRYTGRQTINHDNAYQMAGQLNENLLAIMARARSALTQPAKENTNE